VDDRLEEELYVVVGQENLEIPTYTVKSLKDDTVRQCHRDQIYLFMESPENVHEWKQIPTWQDHPTVKNQEHTDGQPRVNTESSNKSSESESDTQEEWYVEHQSDNDSPQERSSASSSDDSSDDPSSNNISDEDSVDEQSPERPGRRLRDRHTLRRPQWLDGYET
jgi:nucleosome binding factor SPN SPT16 subunit